MAMVDFERGDVAERERLMRRVREACLTRLARSMQHDSTVGSLTSCGSGQTGWGEGTAVHLSKQPMEKLEISVLLKRFMTLRALRSQTKRRRQC